MRKKLRLLMKYLLIISITFFIIYEIVMINRNKLTNIPLYFIYRSCIAPTLALSFFYMLTGAVQSKLLKQPVELNIKTNILSYISFLILILYSCSLCVYLLLGLNYQFLVFFLYNNWIFAFAGILLAL